MPDYREQPEMRAGERLVGIAIDLLRWTGARRASNAILGLLRHARQDKLAPARPQPVSELGLPSGPFAPAAATDAPALLIFVPRRLKSRLIDGATGGYGYSHLAVDCGEIDQPTGRRVMIESEPGTVVHRSFIDEYGQRPFVRIPLMGKGFDVEAFSDCVRSKLGEAYDNAEALTWGEVDDPAKQICSDLAAVCLPQDVLDAIAAARSAGHLPGNSVTIHHGGTPECHAFVSPNAFAAFFGAPPGERLSGPNQPVTSSMRRRRGLGQRRSSVRAKLIYNPIAGGAGGSGGLLTQILAEMQRGDILPEVHLVTPESQLRAVAADAIRRGFRLIVVAGGDGTIESVMGALIGTRATLGIIPTGTRNNVAFSLGIPDNDIPAAVSLLRTGRWTRVDVGRAQSDGAARWFLEAGSVGLVSALYPAADDLQHGDLARVTDLVSTFVSAEPSQIRLEIDGRQVIVEHGHVVLLANMPYLGARFHPAGDIAFDDGWLDVLVFGQFTKLDLLGYALQITSGGPIDDPRVARYRAQRVDIHTMPPMLAMVDGVMLGRGTLRVTLRRRALAVMAGRTSVPGPATAAAGGATVTKELVMAEPDAVPLEGNREQQREP